MNQNAVVTRLETIRIGLNEVVHNLEKSTRQKIGLNEIAAHAPSVDLALKRARELHNMVEHLNFTLAVTWRKEQGAEDIARAEYEDAIRTYADRWVPACGGNEPVMIINGRRWQYCFNPHLRKHGWLDLETDLISDVDPAHSSVTTPTFRPWLAEDKDGA